MELIPGQTIQYWTILEKSTNKLGKHPLWICRCVCGKNKEVIQQGLKNGTSGSCGCKSHLKKYRLKKGESSFNEVYGTYINRAKRKNQTFELTKEQFREITSQNCYYCNKEPAHASHPERSNGIYFYNSIDRKDNKKGYILTNCLPACGDCNNMRNTILTVEEMQVAMAAVIIFRKGNITDGK